jgi:hypothetical protein
MNPLLLLTLTIPFLCLALLSSVAFLGVVSLAAALRLFRMIKSALGTSTPGAKDHPWQVEGCIGCGRERPEVPREREPSKVINLDGRATAQR